MNQTKKRAKLMTYARSRAPGGKSFEEGNDKKVPTHMADDVNADPMSFFDVWNEAGGSYS